MKLSTFNAPSDKAMPVITPIGVVVGLALGSRIAGYQSWANVIKLTKRHSDETHATRQ